VIAGRYQKVSRPRGLERRDGPLGRRDIEEPLDVEGRSIGRERTVAGPSPRGRVEQGFEDGRTARGRVRRGR
jgi:hypothetical protein